MRPDASRMKEIFSNPMKEFTSAEMLMKENELLDMRGRDPGKDLIDDAMKFIRRVVQFNQRAQNRHEVLAEP